MKFMFEYTCPLMKNLEPTEEAGVSRSFFFPSGPETISQNVVSSSSFFTFLQGGFCVGAFDAFGAFRLLL